MITDTSERELLTLSQRLLEVIDNRDWEAYTELCDPSLTAFEPEAVGNRVHGLDFHHFYFQGEGTGQPQRSTICAPEVRIMGDVAVVTYVRLTQRIEEGERSTSTTTAEETRVWQRQNGIWKHVHFHRSSGGTVQL